MIFLVLHDRKSFPVIKVLYKVNSAEPSRFIVNNSRRQYLLKTYCIAESAERSFT